MNRRQAIGLAVGAIVCPEQFVAPPNIDMDELGELTHDFDSETDCCRYCGVPAHAVEDSFVTPRCGVRRAQQG